MCHRTNAIHVAPCCYDPSWTGYSGFIPSVALTARTNGKLTPEGCNQADKDYKKYKKLMWKENIFTKKRSDYEKKANAANKISKACKKAKIDGREKGYPKMSISELWKSDPHKRPVDAGLVVSEALTGPDIQNILTAAVKGWNPTVVIALEWRGEIAGGLAALQAAGVPEYANIDPASLQKFVAMTLSPKDNETLLKMVGAKGTKDKDLKAAAKDMRARVAKLGDAAMKYAFGMRGLYMSSGGAVLIAAETLVKAVVIIVLNVIPVVGTLISAAAGVTEATLAAVAQALANAAKERMTALVKEATAELQAEAAEKQAEADAAAAKEAAKAEAAAAKAAGTASGSGSGTDIAAIDTQSSKNKLLLAGAAVAAVAAAAFLYSHSQKTKTESNR